MFDAEACETMRSQTYLEGEKENKTRTERACREFRCEGWNVW